MSIVDMNEVIETYQDLVDKNILTLEAAQDFVDDHINDIIIETKKEIDDVFNEGLITAYEKNICYINIGLDADTTYEEVINSLIEQELSYIEEKSKEIDPKKVPSKEEYYKQQMEKQAKKEKRKNFFKKVGTAALAAGAIAGTAYAASKAEKSGNDRKVVRPDNPEYAAYFTKREAEVKKASDKYEAAMKRAKTDVEKSDLTNQFKATMKAIDTDFNKTINQHKNLKREAYAKNQAKEQEAYNRAVQNTTDPEKLADFERHHKETMDKWDVDKENRKKMDQFNRSDFHRRQELNREDPNNMNPVKRLLLKKRQEKKMEKINKRYDTYNKKNIK